MSTVTREHIESTAGVCGGRPRIAGTRIRIQDVYAWHELEGLSPDEIVDRHPQLTLADVHAAMAFYFDHREELQQQMREDADYVQSLRLALGPGPLETLSEPGQVNEVSPG